MAGEEVKCFGTRKRKRGYGKKKLLLSDKVEVRSVENGFHGSWHPGTVIRCGKLKRYVRFDNVLDDNGSDYLVDVVGVSPVLDGRSSSNCIERGFIRPLPPLTESGNWDFPYGLCVDVNYEEAWWEGVIFDHCNGMEERSVFFPDLGDEIKIGIGNLRITQDWDEVTETWEPRGNWVFLELVEECKQAMYVAVSVKQIWYDVRTKEDFDKIRDWTSDVKDLWRDLVKEVISEYVTLTLEEVFQVLDLPKGFMEGTVELESIEPTANVDLNCEVHMASCNPCDQPDCNRSFHDDARSNNTSVSDIRIADCPMEKGDLMDSSDTDRNCGSITPVQEKYAMDSWEDQALGMHTTDSRKYCLEKEVLMQKEAVPPVQHANFPKGISCNCSGSACELVAGSTSVKRNRKYKESAVRRSFVDWQPLILSETEFCPDAINFYAHKSKNISRRLLHPYMIKVQKHLLYLGWKIEWVMDNNQRSRKYRYWSPNEQVYMSLYKVCRDVIEDPNKNRSLSQDDQRNMIPSLESNLSHLPKQVENSQDSNILPEIAPSPSSVKVLLEAEYCPRAVVEYYMHPIEKCQSADKVGMRVKAKKHLLAEGWTIYYPDNRRGLSYRSPNGQTYLSLRKACRGYIKESIPKLANCGLRPLDILTTGKENISQDDADNLLHLISQLLRKEPDLHTTESARVRNLSGNRNIEDSKNSKSRPSKRERKGVSKRVLRSTKTVQKVSSPGLLHQKPQNVLSWLIERNRVLPRAKVYYQVRGWRHPKAEGRVTRDGIKCSCCQKVYSLAGFECHATGSSNSLPAARIFLEDGKSLLDCQKQILHDFKRREAITKPYDDWCQGENDYICSVCHYGGELILCDQCPSSFHKNCLGLTDTPDGDWFCPSCRCGSCGQSKIEGVDDGHFLTCSQCENKYHIRCLRKRRVDKTSCPENWFCGKNCEKIYTGLDKLLGQPIVVGANNITWTLMKFASSESCGLDNPADDLLAESYGKLNVALAVMHECFEPLKEPNSTRDFMEDVLFSRRSELNRLNFQGFYTVLLERNDELISVATVRVYGERVAEVPLIGTRLQYRRLGMCRILMDELEKRLFQLGVERLVLPAVPSVLETWINCFGFSKMTTATRSQFLDKTFLDFQDTIMCQKLLKMHSPDSVLLTEVQPRSRDISSVIVSTDFDVSSTVSEAYQAGKNEETGMLDLQLVENVAGNKVCLAKGAINHVAMEKQPIQNGTNPGCPVENSSLRQVGRKADDAINSSMRCYKRRRLAGGKRVDFRMQLGETFHRKCDNS